MSAGPLIPDVRLIDGRTYALGRPERSQHRGGLKRPYSITSSARANSNGGIVSPSTLAVLPLMTNSNLVGCSIGSSPLRPPNGAVEECHQLAVERIFT